MIYEPIDISNSSLTSCSGAPATETLEERTRIDYLMAVDSTFTVFNICHIAVILYGFKSIVAFKSDYHGYSFTDIFYSLSCVGSVIFLTFCAIANIATVTGTATTYWSFYGNDDLSSCSNITNARCTILSGILQCASPLLSTVSNSAVAYEISQLIQVLLSSLFVLQAGQMLPHGNVTKNRSISEVVQYLGVTHLFLWIVNSFVYNPHIDYFFVVEIFYFGEPTFDVIARLTYPLIVFYHFTTALRCFALFRRYNSKP